MLTITPQALGVIRQVSASAALEPSPGVRIAAGPGSSASLEVRAVPAPHPGDSMVERGGARLYLDRVASGQLEGRELDAVNDPDGRVRFTLRSAA